MTADLRYYYTLQELSRKIKIPLTSMEGLLYGRLMDVLFMLI